MSNPATRIPELDILKGFAMICMVIGHSIIVYPIDISHVAWCEGLHNFIYSFHMELLFLLSGFLYRRKEWLPYVKGKVNRILVPYLIWGAVFLLMPVLFSPIVHRETPFADGVVNYLLYGGGYWFLYVLFIIFMIYPLIDMLQNGLKTVMMVALLFANYFIKFPSVLCLDLVMFYLTFFMAGNLLSGIVMKHYVDGKLNRWLGLIGLLFMCLLITNRFIPVPAYFTNFIRTVCVMGLLAVASNWLYYTAIGTKDIVLGKMVSVTSLCGQYSLQLYLFNGFLMVPLRVLLCSVMHVENAVAIVSVISVVDIAISLLVCVYLLPKSKILSYVCGVK